MNPYWRIEYDHRSDVAAYICRQCGAQGPQVWEGEPTEPHCANRATLCGATPPDGTAAEAK